MPLIEFQQDRGLKMTSERKWQQVVGDSIYGVTIDGRFRGWVFKVRTFGRRRGQASRWVCTGGSGREYPSRLDAAYGEWIENAQLSTPEP